MIFYLIRGGNYLLSIRIDFNYQRNYQRYYVHPIDGGNGLGFRLTKKLKT